MLGEIGGAAAKGVYRERIHGRHEGLEFEAEIPPNTQWVMVRCVVVGTGKAWFDNVVLHVMDEESETEEEEEDTVPEEEPPDEISRVTDRSIEALVESNKALAEINKLPQGLRGELNEIRAEKDRIIERLKTENEALKRSLSTRPDRPVRPIFRRVPKN